MTHPEALNRVGWMTAFQPVIDVCTCDAKLLHLTNTLFVADLHAVGSELLVCTKLQEKVKRMTPEQRAKFEARQERVQTKRAMKQRMIRA